MTLRRSIITRRLENEENPTDLPASDRATHFGLVPDLDVNGTGRQLDGPWSSILEFSLHQPNADLLLLTKLRCLLGGTTGLEELWIPWWGAAIVPRSGQSGHWRLHWDARLRAISLLRCCKLLQHLRVQRGRL